MLDYNVLDKINNKVGTVWVGAVRFPGLITVPRNESGVYAMTLLVSDIQHKNVYHYLDLDTVTAITVDSDIDSEDKFQAAKKAAEEKNRAAAAEYMKQAEALAALEKKDAANSN